MTEYGHCILCPNPLSADTKPEHLWLQSAGGKKTSRRLYCDACNSARQALEMLKVNYRTGSDREINRIIDAAWSKLQLGPGSLLTREILDRFSREVANRFTFWMLNLPFEEKVSVSDLADSI